MEQVCREPYRLLFPLGLLYGLWGVFLWIGFGFGISQQGLTQNGLYPGTIHAFLMVGGFLASFAFGFLMTAIPRFTRSFPARRLDLLLVATPLATLPIFALSGETLFVLCPLLISFLGFMRFASQRFLKRQAIPPDSFIFIAVGIFSGFAGTLILIIARMNSDLTSNWSAFGRSLFLQAFMISLLVGVGSRLIPGLLGSAPPPGVSDVKSHLSNLNRSKALFIRLDSFFTLGLLFILSYFIESFYSLLAGRALRTVLITWIAIRHWRLMELPIIRSILARLLWLSCWLTVLGSWGTLLFPAYQLHFLHITLIGGLSLTTLLIATRVVLAHGGFNLMLESQLKTLWWIAGFIFTAALIRTAAGFFPSFYFSQLTYAAISWIIGLLIWTISLGRRIIFPAISAANEGNC